jgi:hypothetical protein
LMTVIERRAHENLTLGAALPAEARSATCDGRTAAFSLIACGSSSASWVGGRQG